MTYFYPKSYPNPQKVAKRFYNAFDSYNANATAQRQLAKKLAAALMGYLDKPNLSKVLEIGVGTGLLSQELFTQLGGQGYQIGQFFANDIHEGILKIPFLANDSQNDNLQDNHPLQSAQIEYVIGDIRQMALVQDLDLVVSNAVLQWLYPLDALLEKIAQAMRDGGVLAFGTFLDKNLWQIKHLTGQSLQYYNLQALGDLMTYLGFEVMVAHEYEAVYYFDSPMAVLRHLKATGVTAVGDFLWSKASLSQFVSDYQTFCQNEGYPLSYHCAYLIAKKPWGF